MLVITTTGAGEVVSAVSDVGWGLAPGTGGVVGVSTSPPSAGAASSVVSSDELQGLKLTSLGFAAVMVSTGTGTTGGVSP